MSDAGTPPAPCGQPLLETPLWRRSPLYLRTYLWLWTQGHPASDVEAGYDRVLVTTYREMGTALEWTENRRTITPTDDQLRPILGWMEANAFVRVQADEGIQHSSPVESPHLHSSRMSLKICVCDLRRWKDRADARVLEEEKEIEQKGVLPGGLKPKKPAKAARPRDEWLDDMALNWDRLRPGTVVPYGLFQQWKRDYGPGIPLEALRNLATRKKRIYGPLESYLLAVIRAAQKKEAEAVSSPDTAEDEFRIRRMDERLAEMRQYLEDSNVRTTTPTTDPAGPS